MQASIVRPVEVEYSRPLPWRKWYIAWYSRMFLEPVWMFHLRLLFIIWSGGLPNYMAKHPMVEWYNDFDQVDLRIARNVCGWRIRLLLPELVRRDEGYEDREIEIEFNYWWEPADPSVGYDYDYPDWEIVGATYCDTGEPYEGALYVWNEDIGQHIHDNCWE